MSKAGRWSAAVAAAAMLLAGCAEDGPVAPGAPDGGAAAQFLSCEVDLRGGGLSCSGSDANLADGALGAIIGGQGVYVQLASNNVAFDEVTGVFSASVTVKNLINQIIGSTDGSTPDPDGIRIFFAGEPTVSGTGTVTVANASGTATFSGGDQDYHQYDQALAPGQTSLPKTWEWNISGSVNSFSFMVGVSAAVPDEGNIAPGLKFQASTIAGDSLHTCAIDLHGQAWCWGRQNYGKLGNGLSGSDTVATPTRVLQEGLRFVSIAAGLHHTCAISDVGDAWCWGTAEHGRVGVGDTVNPTAWFTTPVKVHGNLKFIQLTAGRRFTCGVTVDHDAYCWGANQQAYSPLGDGVVNVHRWAPHPVEGGHKFASLGAGKYHTCGLTIDGDAYCWGNGTNGRLGTGNSDHVTVPTKVVGDHKFMRIAGGNASTCAVTTEGVGYCWGSASTHQKLGVLDENGDPLTGTEYPEPLQMTTDLRFVDIHVSPYSACGLAVDGKAYCWGHKGRGRMGVGNTSPANAPTPIEVAGGHTFVEIATGLEQTCGWTPDRELYCWGMGTNGQIGDGLITNAISPRKVTLTDPPV